MERRQGDERRRRPRAVSPYPESAQSILPGVPRVASLDALLREVDGLRLSLETDLTLAAAAVEAGQLGVALDIIDSDREGLIRFEHAALGHLSDLDEARGDAIVPIRSRIGSTLAPILATAAALALAFGFAPQVFNGTEGVDTSTVAAQSRLDQLQGFAAQGNTSQVRATAQALHAQLVDAIANAGTDPEGAQQALLLLSYERDAITASGDGVALHDILVQSVALANRIRAALPAQLRKTVPQAPVVVVAQPSPSPSSSPKASPTTSPSPKPSPKPSATASPSGSPSASPSDGGPGSGVIPSGHPVNGG